jgi:deoxyadenosine/deoxycytidine kinase
MKQQKNNVAPQIVEIVGPAGAGKTTLYQALRDCKDVRLSNFPDIRKISTAFFFLWNGLQISATLRGLSRNNSKKLSRREFAWLSILYGWPSVLQKELKNNQHIVLDQGPVYLLTGTISFGPNYLREEQADFFWQDMYSRWADTLKIIVWLDAPDADLMKRIRSRNKEHVVKNETVESTFEFLAGYRKAYERIISNLMANQPGLKILRFDTSQIATEEIANQLLREFNQRNLT